ncbi:hypothetical protein [Herbiconiux ginsengi]|uniref:Uncharacterized protein n=1 Tax=Herbiconiux ginsengi TaxID=381665 RepID=A0A1H3SNG2_9MICO|nr:hypothetical protein [Herbiconiux ginsengi]SDZ39526.1 hypothetical protein SAMN05216554_3527 [Herbiconiux ginsengi]
MTTNTAPHERRTPNPRFLVAVKVTTLVVSAIAAVTLTIIAFAVQP